jgi:hypothetical protein
MYVEPYAGVRVFASELCETGTGLAARGTDVSWEGPAYMGRAASSDFAVEVPGADTGSGSANPSVCKEIFPGTKRDVRSSALTSFGAGMLALLRVPVGPSGRTDACAPTCVCARPDGTQNEARPKTGTRRFNRTLNLNISKGLPAFSVTRHADATYRRSASSAGNLASKTLSASTYALRRT